MPSAVPATLKSMSPSASSTPWMSVRTAKRPSASVIRPIATPATGALIGTPASISARVLPQVLAIEVEPFDDRTSETTRMVYGNSCFVRQHRQQRPLGERAVADVPPRRGRAAAAPRRR